jgi:hypothetical protein
VGQSERTEGCSDQSPTLNVRCRTQAHRSRTEGEMGEVDGEAGIVVFA